LSIIFKRNILKGNSCIEITDEGLEGLCEGLKRKKGLKKLEMDFDG